MGSGCWVCQRGSVGENVTHWLWMLRWGQCFTHTALKCLCTVFPLLSSLPFRLPLFPPPINDPFVRVFFAAVGWRASAGLSPKTSGLSWNRFSLAVHNLRPLYLTFLVVVFYLGCFLIAVFVSLFFFFTACPHTYSSFTIFVLSRHLVLWIFEIPSLPFVSRHILLFRFLFFTKASFVLTPFVHLPFHIVFHSILLNSCRDI